MIEIVEFNLNPDRYWYNGVSNKKYVLCNRSRLSHIVSVYLIKIYINKFRVITYNGFHLKQELAEFFSIFRY